MVRKISDECNLCRHIWESSIFTTLLYVFITFKLSSHDRTWMRASTKEFSGSPIRASNLFKSTEYNRTPRVLSVRYLLSSTSAASNPTNARRHIFCGSRRDDWIALIGSRVIYIGSFGTNANPSQSHFTNWNLRRIYCSHTRLACHTSEQ